VGQDALYQCSDFDGPGAGMRRGAAAPMFAALMKRVKSKQFKQKPWFWRCFQEVMVEILGVEVAVGD